MKPVLIVQHVAHEGPGYIGEFFRSHEISFEMLRIDAAEPVPGNANAFSGLVIMGGPMSVNDDLPWIAPETNLIRAALKTGVPVLGHCLGGQLMARALGAAVTRNAVSEFGWLPVDVEDNSSAHEWFGHLPRRFEAFHWHGETFACPSGATPVLRSEFCDNQGFVIGNSLALQCHVEMTNDLVYEWVHRAEPGLLTPAPSIQSGEEMLAGLDDRVARLQHAADAIYTHWVRGLR